MYSLARLAAAALVATSAVLSVSAAPLSAREPHPAQIKSPASGETLTAGKPFEFWLIDGEDFPADVKWQLVPFESGKPTYDLGTLQFDDFSAKGDLTVPQTVPAGSYSLVATEEGGSDPSGNSVVKETVVVQQGY